MGAELESAAVAASTMFVPPFGLGVLQLACAQAMMGEKAAAGKSYQDFLTLWKDADSDIAIYQQAKAEYARLR